MTILFEYDRPRLQPQTYYYEAGIPYYQLTPPAHTITDDYGIIGYYEDTNVLVFTVNSAVIDDITLTQTTSLNDCRITEDSFFYAAGTRTIYFHLAGFRPILDSTIYIGVSVGYSLGATDPWYNNIQYPPLLSSAPSIKKAVDPLYFGLHKYNELSLNLINNTGIFDNWVSFNLYGQAARVYVDDEIKYSGFIENYSRSFTDFSVTLQDLRKSLSQPVATRTLSIAEYVNLNTDLVDQIVPVAYGKLWGRAAYCLDENALSPTYNTFIFADTTYNSAASVDAVYIDGVAAAAYNTSLSAGTFQLLHSAVVDNYDNVTVDFTMSITSAVTTIKDLMLNYDGKPYVASFWDLTDVDAIPAAQSLATSLYIDDDTTLAKCIEAIAGDSALRMFVRDDGRYTIRAYDEDRVPIKTIYKTEWLDTPKVDNTGSDYLTSCIIKYGYNDEKDTWLQYENLTYETAAFAKYKKYKSKTYETGLTTLASAMAYSEIIMGWSSNVQDVIKRKTSWTHADLEITDYIITDPVTRINAVEALKVYEVLGATKNTSNGQVELTMRYVREADIDILEYYARVDESGNYHSDESENIEVIAE